MFNNISHYLNKEDYRISILPYGIHILKYKSVLDITENNCIIKMDNKLISIKGNNLKLSTLDKCELLITGTILGVDINEY